MYKIRARVRFSLVRAGEFQLWIDDKEAVNLGRQLIGYRHSILDAAGYWQYGIYRDGNPNALAVTYQDMQQGSGIS